jgi:hypothetical protein
LDCAGQGKKDYKLTRSKLFFRVLFVLSRLSNKN